MKKKHTQTHAISRLTGRGARAPPHRHAADLQAVDQEAVLEQRLGFGQRRPQDHPSAVRRRPRARPRAEGAVEPRARLPERVRRRVSGPRAQRRRAQACQGEPYYYRVATHAHVCVGDNACCFRAGSMAAERERLFVWSWIGRR